MNNPMAQLEQWKSSHQQTKINRFVNEMNNAPKIGPVKSAVKNSVPLKFENNPKTQQEAQNATKAKRQVSILPNPLSLKYAQITRQFKLILDSNQRCLEVYPDDFHHKLKMRDECSDLIERLKGGGKLLNSLAKSSDLDQEQTALLQAFNAGNGYLIRKFAEVVEQINELNIERVEIEKLQGAGNE